MPQSEGFKEDWVPGYADRALAQRISRIVDDYAETLRLELTIELLDTVFATGDGTRVSWRDATVDQHEERITVLGEMISGTTETAAMHVAAVKMIRQAGVDTLGQLDGEKRGSAA